jgi:outer membrane protein TolC
MKCQVLQLLLIFSGKLFLLLQHVSGFAQTPQHINISECFLLAQKNAPLAKQQELTRQSGNRAIENINQKWLPEINFNAQATYQSAVTSLPIKLPNVTIEQLSKDQYKGSLEIVQPILDGGVIENNKAIQALSTRMEVEKLAIELYQLKLKVNNQYFTVLLMDENIALVKAAQKDIETNLKKVNAQVRNGTAIETNADLLQVELFKLEQKMTELAAARNNALEQLGLLTHREFDTTTVLDLPKPAAIINDSIYKRPELALLDYSLQNIQLQQKLIDNRANPKLSFFANGGYGKPGFNALANEFDFFYIGGIRLNVPLTGRYTKKKEKAILNLQEQIIQTQKTQFNSNNLQLMTQIKNEITKQQVLINTDDRIIDLRNKIKENAAFRLSNGMITSNDYLTELNAAYQAALNKQIHQMQLLQNQYQYQIITGN